MDLKAFGKLLKKRLWVIILCVLVSTSTTVAYTYYFSKPLYTASTKLIINKTVEEEQMGNEEMDFGAISVNIGLINTYKEIIRTPAILDKVVQRYPELNLTSDELLKHLDVSALNNTQVVTLSIADDSYERAADIVNAVTEVVRTEIPRIMKVNNVEVLNIADPSTPSTPITPNSAKPIVMSFGASLFISIAIVFLLEQLDDTLKTKREIQTIFGVSTLSMIPVLTKKELKSLKKKSSRKRTGDVSYVTSTQ